MRELACAFALAASLFPNLVNSVSSFTSRALGWRMCVRERESGATGARGNSSGGGSTLKSTRQGRAKEKVIRHSARKNHLCTWPAELCVLNLELLAASKATNVAAN